MSFILDALKKSESDRLRKDTPGFVDVPDRAREKSSSHWIWIIVVLIVINITVLLVMFLKPERMDEPLADAASPADSIQDSAALPNTVIDDSQIVTPDTEPVSNSAVPQTATTAAQPPAPVADVANSGSSVVTESYATFNDLRAQGVLNLPDMHLDIHVYSAEPEDRFVFVNMSKYKENATLDEGPVVREITPDGVVLEHFGTSFLLPRE